MAMACTACAKAENGEQAANTTIATTAETTAEASMEEQTEEAGEKETKAEGFCRGACLARGKSTRPFEKIK